MTIDSDLAPTASDMVQIRAGLMAFSESQAGPVQIQPVAVYLRDDDGAIQGGLVGYFAWRWLSIEWLWVSETLRGQGHGSALLRQAESLARDAGCVAVKLDTYEFQEAILREARVRCVRRPRWLSGRHAYPLPPENALSARGLRPDLRRCVSVEIR